MTILSRKSLTKLAMTICVLNASGCATTSNETYGLDTSDVDQKMVLAAKAVQGSIKVLEQNSNFVTSRDLTSEQKSAIREQANYMPPGLGVPILLEQRLPLEKAVKLIADMTDYKVDVINQPRQDVMVTVHSNGRQAVDVLRDIGTTIGERATVRVIPNKIKQPGAMYGVIQIQYANEDKR